MPRSSPKPVVPVVGFLPVLLAGASVVAAQCVPVAGGFTSVGVVGPPCGSPILLCTDGTLTGDLAGKYDFTMASLAPALAPGDPLLFVFTGTSLITTGAGQISAEDQGKLRFNPAGPSPFVTLVQVKSGSGAFAGATGVIVATGELDFSTNKAVGAYTGALCFP